MSTLDLKQSVTWLILASLIGFLVPAVFFMGFRWERSLFLVSYVSIIGENLRGRSHFVTIAPVSE